MIISAKIIKKPRVVRKCYGCNKIIIGKTLRLFGAADTFDKPYVIYLHPDCCSEHVRNEKIRSVLDGYKNR